MRKDMQKIEAINKKKKIRSICIIAAVICICAAAIVFIAIHKDSSKDSENTGGSATAGPNNSSNTGGSATAGPDNNSSTGGTFDMNKPSHYADIEIENYGKITVALYRDAAPITVDNFVSLAKSGFYDGLTFHRIMKGFMMQGGDPEGNGSGGSDKEIKGEFSANGYNNPISHTRGAISMARSKKYDSASSQFFIVHEDSTFLDGEYAAFGYVTEGLDVVDKVCTDAKPIDGNGTIPASAQPVITKITIREAI